MYWWGVWLWNQSLTQVSILMDSCSVMRGSKTGKDAKYWISIIITVCKCNYYSFSSWCLTSLLLLFSFISAKKIWCNEKQLILVLIKIFYIHTQNKIFCQDRWDFENLLISGCTSPLLGTTHSISISFTNQ